MRAKKKTLHSSMLLVLTAFIWGVAFVAQSEGMNHVGAFTFNACRFVLGGAVLIPCIFWLKRKGIKEDRQKQRKQLWTGIRGGICCGTVLCLASSLQQLGIAHTTVGKAGFITSLYIIIVPVLGMFVHKKVGWNLWLSVGLAAAGMYLLCIGEGFAIGRGDLLICMSAIAFSLHILVIDYFSPKADGVLISCVQFFTAGILSAIVMFVKEQPQLSGILSAGIPILYAGVMSCAVGYTLQVVAQKDVEPTIASLLMSLESVFSLLAGMVILTQIPSAKEAMGCVLVFVAIMLAQIPVDDWFSR